jgi:type IV pilus assembly protein PilA
LPSYSWSDFIRAFSSVPRHHCLRHAGFTLIEIIVVIAIIAILALMTVPSMQDRIVREQVVEAARIAEVAKAAVEVAWRTTEEMPVDNEEAGLPAADKLVGNHVSAVTVEDGAIHITFGNNVNGVARGKQLTLRPAVVEDTPLVPVAWVCGGAAVPDKMTALGRNRTNLEDRYLPVNCRTTTVPG